MSAFSVEGGLIAFDSPPFLYASDADATPFWQGSFAELFDTPTVAAKLAQIRDGVRDQTFEFASTGWWPSEKIASAASGAGLQVNRNAFDGANESEIWTNLIPNGFEDRGEPIDSADFGTLYESDRPGSQVDNLGGIVRVLPISPPDGIASPSEGGAIAVTAFAGMSPLGLPASSTSSLASREVRAGDGAIDSPALPAGGAAADGLRGRAVVFEVAHVEVRAPHSDGALSPTSERSDPWISVRGATTQSRPGAAHRAVAGIAQAPTKCRTDATPEETMPFKALAALAAAAADQQAAHTSGGREDVATSADKGAAALAAVDAAFADEAGAAAAVADRIGAIAAFADKHHRHLLGLAAAVVVSAGPLAKVFKRRAQREPAEHLPPQRRWGRGSLRS